MLLFQMNLQVALLSVFAVSNGRVLPAVNLEVGLDALDAEPEVGALP